MRRQNPFLSPFGLLLCLFLFGGLGFGLARSGGLAFSPGPLSAKQVPGKVLQNFTSHAEFASECHYCHAPLEAPQDVLCLDCHNEVEAQIDESTGVHGALPKDRTCAGCHSDHRGGDFDPTLAALPYFDHNQAAFELVWHQVDFTARPMECAECHILENQFDFSPSSCSVCHSQADPQFMIEHTSDFGDHCLACHDGSGSLAQFDHTRTDFPLDGAHQQVSCGQCHHVHPIGELQVSDGKRSTPSKSFDRLFAGLPADCSGCHAEPDPHAGLFSSDCAECHETGGWLPARFGGQIFEHTSLGFTLDHHHQDSSGRAILCRDCHTGGPNQWSHSSFDIQPCQDCHSAGDAQVAFMTEHQNRFGRDCLTCHDGVDRMQNFDHARVFPLDGSHAALECESCHAGHTFHVTPRSCSECHQEPAIHAGVFGLQCRYCHETQAWTPAFLRFHDFPLDHGGQGELACETCHTNTYSQWTCYSCHEHQPEETLNSHLGYGVSAADLSNCIQCHPGGVRDG